MRKLIAVFATEISSRVQSSIYISLHEKIGELGYNLVFFSATNNRKRLQDTDMANYELFKMAEDVDFSAFIIHGQSIGEVNFINTLIKLGLSKNIPVFLLDSEQYDVIRDDGVICIDPDYKRGFALTVRHVIEQHKCKNIFMLGGIKDNPYSDERIDAYKEEMEAHGLEISEKMIGYGDFWEIPAIKAVEAFLDSGLPKPDAICCANDSMAISATKTLNSRGFRVPEDVIVTGFDGIEDGKYNIPAIATCELDTEALADFFVAYFKGEDKSSRFLIPLKFIPKKSCGCEDSNLMEDAVEIERLVKNNRQSFWQHHQLGIMQFELMDCSDIFKSSDYLDGALNLFPGYAHLFCLRNEIELLNEYSSSFERMSILLNKGYSNIEEHPVFDINEGLQKFSSYMHCANEKDFFVIRLLHYAEKKYGFHIFRTDKYEPNDIRVLGQFDETLTNMVVVILRNKKLEVANQKLCEMYEHMSEIYVRDTMTGLYNRHGYYQELDKYINRDCLKDGFLHIVSIDMDEMKKINDTYGHLEGDYAIKAVAKAIGDCFAHPYVSARFGGDEFMVAFFTGQEGGPSVEKLSMKLNNYLECSESLLEKPYAVRVSVGMATVKISEIKDFKSIEKLADESMYDSKRKKKVNR